MPKPLKHCFVVCPGSLAAAPGFLIELLEDALTIAVDGGLSHFEQWGLPPSVWVGDGDSRKKKNKRSFGKGAFSEVKLESNKAYSDLEYALHVAGKLRLDGVWSGDLILLGAQGERFDQDFGNLLSVDWWLRDMLSVIEAKTCPNVVSYGEHGTWTASVSSVDMNLKPGTLFSVFAFDGHTKLTIKGAEFEIARATEFGHATHGLSNRAKKAPVQVKSHPTVQKQRSSERPFFVIMPKQRMQALSKRKKAKR